MNRPIVAIGAPREAPLATVTAPSSTEGVVDAVRATSGDVILAARTPADRRVARAARLALGAERIGVLYTPMPYTAWVATLQVLGTTPPDVALSRSAEIASALAGALRTQVVLSSVAALEKPSPTIGQHLRGWFPGARFLVDLGAGTVGGLKGEVHADSSLVVVARSAKPVGGHWDARWPEGRIELGAVDAGWKAQRWVEVTSLDEQQWYAATARLRQPAALAAHCSACDRPGSLATCLFCEIPLSVGAPAESVPVGGVPE